MDLKNAKPLKVKGEQEGIIQLELPKDKVHLTPFVVFVRPNGGDFEIIARGKVETLQNNSVLVTLDRTSILKYPLAGDLAIPLGTPRDWPHDSDPRMMDAAVQAQPAELEPDPGYIQIAYGQTYGSLASSASDGLTNAYKDIPKYRPTSLSFAWYFDFLWHMGLEYESSKGTFPTSTYYHDYGNSNDQWTTFSINYRFRRYWLSERLRPAVHLLNTSSQFATLNKDEALFSSSMTATGAGLRLSYEPKSMVWKPDHGSGIAFREVHLDLNYYPSVTVTDGEFIKRGTSSPGSQISEIKLAASAILYADWIPFFKRYTLEAGYVRKSASFTFAGPTQSESGGGYTIPQNLSAKEDYQWFYISAGICFEDYIGRLFKPR